MGSLIGEELEVGDERPDDYADQSDFGRTTVLLMESYEGGRGRTLDPSQVKALAEGLLSMADTIQAGVAYTEQIDAEIAELKNKRKFWPLKQE